MKTYRINTGGAGGQVIGLTPKEIRVIKVEDLVAEIEGQLQLLEEIDRTMETTNGDRRFKDFLLHLARDIRNN